MLNRSYKLTLKFVSREKGTKKSEIEIWPLTTSQVGKYVVSTLTVVENFPQETLPVAPPRTLPTSPRAKLSGVSFWSDTSLPVTLASICFSTGPYLDVRGSSYCVGALLKILVFTAPTLTVTTRTPSGCSSKRKHSLMVTNADLEPA